MLFLCQSLMLLFLFISKTRLVRELEKKFSGKHVVIVAQVCTLNKKLYSTLLLSTHVSN